MKKLTITKYLLSIIIVVFCIIRNYTIADYSLFDFWILPFLYFIIEFLFQGDKKKIRLSYGIIAFEVIAFLRYVLVPLSYYFSNSNTNLFFQEKNFLIITLMSLEFIICKIIIHFKLKNHKKMEIEKYDLNWLLVLFSIIIYLGLIVLYPQLSRRIYMINTKDIIDISTTAVIAYNFSSIIINLFIIKVFHDSKKNSGILKVILVLMSTIFFSINTSINTDGNISRWSLIISLITCLILIYYAFKEERKMIKMFSIISVVVLLLLGTFFKFNKTTIQATSFSDFDAQKVINDNLDFKILDAYFAGPYQVKTAIKTSELHGDSITSKTFINDIFANFPIINHSINRENIISYYYNNTYYGNNISRDKICPMIGHGYVYFGILFSSIFSILSIYVCIIICNKMEGKKSLFEAYVLIFSSIYLGIFMCVNMNILFQTIWIKILPLVIIYTVSNKLVLKIKRRSN